MKIMAKQATNIVSTIKLPAGQCTLTGGETPEELYRVHFPDTMLVDDSNDGQGQQSLDISKCIMNKGKWNMARNLTNQSKCRWALSTFKPFKSAGTGETVPALLQQGVEQLVP
jgi:hypothetical protein